MFLAIDWGNSLIKVTLIDVAGAAPQVVDSMRLDPLSIYELPALMASRGVDKVMVCASGDVSPDLPRMLECVAGCRTLTLGRDLPVPVKVDYATPDTLGPDRVAAAAGAALLFPGSGALVVDAGTAVTIDVIDAAGVYHGGNISAGLTLRLGALHRAAAALPVVQPLGPAPEFGYDTATAMRSGALRGLCAEIADAFHRAARRYGAERVVITGGDASLIIPLLRSDYLPDCTLTDCPDLLPLGLLSIFNHNVSISH